MVENTLRRLLETELEAERLVEEALAQQESITREALRESREAEERFAARVGEFRGVFLEKARERASQTLKELERRYDERSEELRKLARERERGAVDAALAIVLDPANL